MHTCKTQTCCSLHIVASNTNGQTTWTLLMFDTFWDMRSLILWLTAELLLGLLCFTREITAVLLQKSSRGGSQFTSQLSEWNDSLKVMTVLSPSVLCAAIRWQQEDFSERLIRILNDWTSPPPLITSSIKDRNHRSCHRHPQIKFSPSSFEDNVRYMWAHKVLAREMAVWSVLNYTKERHPRDQWWQLIWTLYCCRPY